MIRAITFSLIATGAAADGCPTHDDMTSGVTLWMLEDRFAISFQQTSEGLKTVEVDPNAPTRNWSNVEPDPHSLTPRRLSTFEGATLEYQNDPESLVDLDTLGVWRSEITIVPDIAPGASPQDHRTTTTGLFEIRFGETKNVTFGPCSYEAWSVEIELSLENDTHREIRERVFLPELGISVSVDGYDHAYSRNFGFSRFYADLPFDEITAE